MTYKRVTEEERRLINNWCQVGESLREMGRRSSIHLCGGEGRRGSLETIAFPNCVGGAPDHVRGNNGVDCYECRYPKKSRREGSWPGSPPNSHRDGAESLVADVVNLDSHFKLLAHNDEDFSPRLRYQTIKGVKYLRKP